MATPKRIVRIDVRPDGGQGFAVHIECEAGEPIELLATYDQLDAFADTLDDVLLDGVPEEGPS